MLIRILRHINGPLGVDWLAGETHECPTGLARELIAIRAAERIDEAPPSRGVEIDHGDPVVQSRDPQMRRGRK